MGLELPTFGADLDYELGWVDTHTGLQVDPGQARGDAQAWRALRWTLVPDLRDAVLGRLLAENAQRVGGEVAAASRVELGSAGRGKGPDVDPRQGGLL